MGFGSRPTGRWSCCARSSCGSPAPSARPGSSRSIRAANPIVVQPGEPTPATGRPRGRRSPRSRKRSASGMHATRLEQLGRVGRALRDRQAAARLRSHTSRTTIPDLWYEADLACDDYRVAARRSPPTRSRVRPDRHAAWGFTNVMADTQDLFVERLNPDDARLYEFEGDWREAEVVREEIQRQGPRQPEASTSPSPTTARSSTRRSAPTRPLALSWTGLQYPLLTDSATTLARRAQRRGAARGGGRAPRPPLNLLWADRDGNIGYQLAGQAPLRKGGTPDLPKPGWTGEFEWDGTIPYEDLPRGRTRPEGFLVTANNRIVGDDYPHHITSEWMTGYRAQRIEEMLGRARAPLARGLRADAARLHSLPGIETVHRLSRLHPAQQRETRAIERPQELGRRARRRTRRRHDLPRVHRRVRAGDRPRGDPDPELVERWLNKLGGGAVRGRAPRRGASRSGCSSCGTRATRLVRLAAAPEGRDWDDVALEALEEALDGLEERFGRDPDRWRWGRVHGVEFTHPFGEANPLFDASSTARSRPAARARP